MLAPFAHRDRTARSYICAVLKCDAPSEAAASNKAEISVLALYIRRDFVVGITAVALAGRGEYALRMARRATSSSGRLVYLSE